MKSQRLRSLAVVLALLLPQSVLAWNGTGHELVAAIAWDNMTPAARLKAFSILNAASKNICLRELFPAGTLPPAEQQRQTFIIAATWPDHIRSGPCEPALSHRPWHFKDHFWKGISGASGPQAPQGATPAQPPNPNEGNAVERLLLFRPIVACANTPCAAADERAEDLAWTLHLVGDIHQPLHTASRVSPAHPNGDGGGNGFPLSTAPHGPELHSFWDDIIDNSIPLQTGEANQTSIKYLDRVAARITADNPRSSMVNRLTPVDFEAWSGEGFETVKRSAYPATLHEQQQPSDTYRASVFTIADKAIALGGYRLANLLNTILGGPPVASPPPAPGNHLPVPSHIVIVIEENKRFNEIIGDPPKAPFISRLAARGALLNLFAFHHPSQPNYMELFAGDRLGVCADECPVGPFKAQNLGAALIHKGEMDTPKRSPDKMFAGFAENIPATGARSTCKGLFRAKHCPWVDFSNIPTSLSKGFSQFPTTPGGDFENLPVLSFVIPNMSDDMHDGNGIPAQVSAGNTWLQNNLSAYADWAQNHNSLLIVTWDEDSKVEPSLFCPTPITKRPPDNHIATIIMGEPVIAGKKPPDQYTHHDLLRTILDMYGIAPFAGAATAKDITGIWK